MENSSSTKTKRLFYKTWWGVIVAILFLPIFLIWYVWTKTKWNRWAKIGVVLAVVVLSIGVMSSGNSSSTSTPTKATHKISYQVVERWSIPNGGGGKAIVVSPDLRNEADMRALGEKLKNDVASDKNAFIFVFDDKRAASLRSKVLSDELSQADQDYYDQHYIGQYNKNGNSGLNSFGIYLNGPLGDQISVDY